MYTLTGIIRRNVVNAEMQFEKLGYESNNVVNYNTPGYKNVRFEQILSADGYLEGVKRTDHSAGSYYITKNPLDVAITGQGYIPVTTESGEIFYTRDGQMKKSKEGFLVTQDGALVGSGIQIPIQSLKVEIKPDGRVLSYNHLDAPGEVIGEIPLVNFENPEGLELVDGNKFRVTEKAGESYLVKEHDYLAQYGVERSNTNMFETVNQVLRLNASMLASTSLMRVVDDMYNKSINIRQ